MPTRMDGATTRSLFAAHSLTGIVLGGVLFLVCFSGVLALFAEELVPWSRPALRPAVGAGPPASVDRLLAPVRERADAERPVFAVVEPTTGAGLARVQWRHPGDPANRVLWLDPVEATVLGRGGGGLAGFLAELHTDLLLPKPWGRYLVGLAGIVMLASVLTGILVHRKPLRQAFACRTGGRSRLLAYTDGHKLMGLWGLPFHVTIAYTGALLGLAGILVPLTGGVAFQGDVGAARAAFNGHIPSAAGRAVEHPRLEPLVADARVRFPGHRLDRVVVWHYGDAAATARIDLHRPGTLSRGDTRLVYDARTGRTVQVMPMDEGPGRRAFAAITPLHYGTFGGMPLKAIYAALGLAGALLSASGTLIWLERRSARHGARSDARRRPRVEGLAGGFFLGLPLATVLAFHAAAWGLAGSAGYGWLAAGFFAVWLAVTAAGAALATGRTFVVHGLGGVGLLGALVPLSNAGATGEHLVATLAGGHWHIAGVDLAWLLAGVTLAVAARRLRGHARERRGTGRAGGTRIRRAADGRA